MIPLLAFSYVWISETMGGAYMSIRVFQVSLLHSDLLLKMFIWRGELKLQYPAFDSLCMLG